MRVLIAGAVAALLIQASASAPLRQNIPYSEGRPILEMLREDLLPQELQGTSSTERESIWPAWVSRRDAEIRGRLVRGDEDSIVNFLLFGVTFTRQPRIAERDVLVGLSPNADVIRHRIDDLVASIAPSKPSGERLAFVRQALARAGIDPTTMAGQALARSFFADLVARNSAEVQRFVRETAAKHRLSELFRDRGLSSDTSIYPGFAIEQALKRIRTLPAVGAITRVAIVGPGLDFDDKREGYDFYPPQTVQPFALIDSLIRLGRVNAGDLRVTTFDVSPRVNQHLDVSRQRASSGGSYVLELARNLDLRWNLDLVHYWRQFGDRIGTPVAAADPPPGAGRVRARAVRVRPDVVLSITPADVNIVLQRLEDEPFDLIVATNVLVYYDVFEQSLAVVNIAHMLRPGGWFLTNDAISRLPVMPMNLIGQIDLTYSDQLNSNERLTLARRP